MSRAWVAHPVLFAAYPIIAAYSANVATVSIAETWLPMAAVIGGTLLLLGLLSVLLRDASRAGAAVSALVFMVFAYGPLWSAMTKQPALASVRAVDAVWYFLTALAIALALWRVRRGSRTTAVLNAVSGCLVFMASATGLSNYLQSVRAVEWEAPSATTSEESRPRDSHPPDIFYIVLDGYGRSDVIQKTLGFSNANFVAELEKRGFVVSKGSRSNYCQTHLSLTSSLNMEYMPDLFRTTGIAERDRVQLKKMIDRNSVADRLRSRGYKVVGVTTGFPGVDFRSADLLYTNDSGMSLFVAALLERTPLRSRPVEILTQTERRRESLVNAFGTLGKLGAPTASPRLVLAHILSPHPPFVFGANGEPVKQPGPYGFWDGSHYLGVGGTRESYKAGYRGQLLHTNTLLLGAIDKILAGKGPKPVIVLLGDHGSKLGLDQDSKEKTDLEECFANLTAVYGPDGVEAEFAGTITPVNVFRVLLTKLLGESLPRLPDRSYFSTWSHPMQFAEVTESLGNSAGSPRIANVCVPNGAPFWARALRKELCFKPWVWRRKLWAHRRRLD